MVFAAARSAARTFARMREWMADWSDTSYDRVRAGGQIMKDSAPVEEVVLCG